MPGLYVLQLRHWLRSFPLNQFHFISSKAFKESTRDEMRHLAQFLGLIKEETVLTDHKQSHDIVLNEKVLDSRHRTMKSGAATSQKSQTAGKLSLSTSTELLEFFKPFNDELWGLIGRQIDW